VGSLLVVVIPIPDAKQLTLAGMTQLRSMQYLQARVNAFRVLLKQRKRSSFQLISKRGSISGTGNTMF